MIFTFKEDDFTVCGMDENIGRRLPMQTRQGFKWAQCLGSSDFLSFFVIGGELGNFLSSAPWTNHIHATKDLQF